MLCSEKNRYQLQPWYIRLWRRRYLFKVPYYSLIVWWKSLNQHYPLTFRNAWDIEMGMAHIRMGWWFTSKETEEILSE